MRASSASADAGVIDAIVTMIDAASIFGIIQRRALFGLQNVEENADKTKDDAPDAQPPTGDEYMAEHKRLDEMLED